MLVKQSRRMPKSFTAPSQIWWAHTFQDQSLQTVSVWSYITDMYNLYQGPGVQQWNRLLLVIQEVSNCKDLDSLKLTIALKQEDIEKQR